MDEKLNDIICDGVADIKKQMPLIGLPQSTLTEFSLILERIYMAGCTAQADADRNAVTLTKKRREQSITGRIDWWMTLNDALANLADARIKGE